MSEVTLIATAAMGIEAIVNREVKQLGYETTVENGKVIFNAPIEAIPRCNLWLRTADRLKIVVGQFKATTFDELFEQTKSLPWEEFISEDGEFPVVGKSQKSKLYSVSDSQAIVKKAIVDRLKLKYGVAGKMPETGPLYRVEIALHKDMATLTIDTSGSGLHRRGYRVEQGLAPLKETLAAALVLLTNWRADEPLIDPFCGSGTIPIEAAFIGQNIAPGFNREFASEEWSWIKQKYWDESYIEAEDLANYDQPLNIMGSDIDHRMINQAKTNAMEAGLADLIQFKQMNVKDLVLQKEGGYLISNPPYGERMGKQDDVSDIYHTLGKIMQTDPTWSVYILTAFKPFEKTYGQKATRKRKLFNGFIQTDYYQFFGKR